MHINVMGEKIEVGVSEGGMFYDAKTKSISATTIKGLQKKILKLKLDNRPETPVTNENGRKGKVLGRNIEAKGYAKRSYRVRWDDDNSISVHDVYYFHKELTEEEKKEKIRLTTEHEAARAVYFKTNNALTSFNGKTSIREILESAYPMV